MVIREQPFIQLFSSKEYLDFWTCDHCGKHTHEVDYDYLGNGTNHLGCELKLEMGEKN